MTSPRDTRREPALSQTSRGQRGKRERLGTRLESWGLRGSVSSFSLHLPLHSSFHGCSLSPTFAQYLDRNVLLAFALYSRRLLRSLFGSLFVSGKLPTYPSPKPTSTLTSHLGQNVGLGEGYHIMIRLFRALRFWGRRKSERHAKTWRGRRFYFFHVLSQLSRPDYLGAWNRLGLLQPCSQVGLN